MNAAGKSINLPIYLDMTSANRMFEHFAEWVGVTLSEVHRAQLWRLYDPDEIEMERGFLPRFNAPLSHFQATTACKVVRLGLDDLSS